MPSTYTTNNGIELIATGEQSGTWGATTNTNLELVDASLDGQVTITLSSAGSSGSPNNLPVTDGASSNGRNRIVIYNDGGDLGATAYVQLTPNDAEKIIFIRNSLSGSRDIIVFQGTYNASNDYVVPNGTTAVVFFDGAGTGAVAANVFNNAAFDALQLGTSDVSVNKILDQDDMSGNDASALATQQSIKAYVDSQVATADTLAEVLANGNTTGGTNILFGDNDKAIFGAGSDLQIYHDGTHSVIEDAGTGNLILQSNGTQVSLQSSTELYLTAANNGAVTAYHNGSAKLATTSTGIDVTGVITTDGMTTSADINFGDNDKAIFGAGSDLQIYHDGSHSYIQDAGTGNLNIQSNGVGVVIEHTDGTNLAVFNSGDGTANLYHSGSLKLATTSTGIQVTGDISNASGDLTLDVAGDIILDADGGDIRFRDGGTEFYKIAKNGDHVQLFSIIQDGDLTFNGFDGSSHIVALTLDMSAAGAATFNNTVASKGITVTNEVGSPSQINGAANNNALQIFADTTNNQSFGLLVDAGTSSSDYVANFRAADNSTIMRLRGDGLVGIGTDNPAQDLHIREDSGDCNLLIDSANGASQIFFGDDESVNVGKIGYNHASNFMAFHANASEAVRIDSSGNVGIGTSSPNFLLDVEGSGSLFRINATSGDATAQFSVANTTSLNTINFGDSGSTTSGQILYRHNGDSMAFNVGGAEAVRILNGGNVGIGTSSPSSPLEVAGGSAFPTTKFSRDGGSAATQGYLTTGFSAIGYSGGTGADTYMVSEHGFGFAVNAGTNALIITDGGNVGIGTSSPSFISGSGLEIQRAGIATLRLEDTGSSGKAFELSIDDSTGAVLNSASSGLPMIFKVINSERARIDTSGNFMVGTTDTFPGDGDTNTGVSLTASGSVAFSRDGARVVSVNRNTSDGTLIEFNKDGNAVGSIASRAGVVTTIVLNPASGNGAGLSGGTKAIVPADEAGIIDDDISLGVSTHRFKDLHLSGNINLSASAQINSSTAFYLDSDIIHFRRNNEAESARIDSSGNLLVGCTTKPSASVKGTMLTRDLASEANKTAVDATTSTAHFVFFNPNGSVGSISTSGSATAFNTSSDQRLKDNIVDAPSASNDIDAIQVRSFDWKADGSHQRYGMVAQELQSVAPEAVTGDADSDDMMGVDYSKLVPMMMKEIQSLRARVAQLEGEN